MTASFYPLLRTLLVLPVLLARAIGEEPALLVHTFSIVACDPRTGDLGVAVASKYLAVGNVVPWARAGIGAVATQSMARMSFGPEGLRLMESGKSPREALDGLLAADPQAAWRQVGMVDARGRVASATGDKCMAHAGHFEAENFCVQGNLLAGPQVLVAMREAFERTQKSPETELADWLIAALSAGQSAGGDRRGQQSAALLVVRANGGPGGDNDRYIDLRVDDHPTPVSELARLLALHKTFYAGAHAKRAE